MTDVTYVTYVTLIKIKIHRYTHFYFIYIIYNNIYIIIYNIISTATIKLQCNVCNVCNVRNTAITSKFPFIYSICVTYPLHRYGRQQLCSWCNAPLAKHLTLLTQPAFECTATDSSCSSQLTLQVTFHRSFPPYYYYDVKLQKNIEICKKFHYIFQAIMVNIGQ